MNLYFKVRKAHGLPGDRITAILSVLDSVTLVAAIVLSLLVILNLVVFVKAMLSVPDHVQVQYTPDDAYYYLVLARNFASYGTWTFDSGQTVTTGFHPLLAYLLAAISLLTRPTPGQYVHFGLLLSAAITFLAVGSGLLVAYRVRQPILLLVLALITSSKNFVFNSVSIVEWPLVVLISGLYFIYLYRSLQTTSRLRPVVVLFLLGLAGSLARSDFGLLPLSMFLATLYVWRLTRSDVGVTPALAGLLGATIGVVVVLGHNYLFTGQFLPSSALVKAHWSTFTEASVAPIATFTPQLLSISPGSKRKIVWVAMPLILALGVRLSRFRRSELFDLFAGSPQGLVLLLGSSVTILGYGFLYSRNAAVQPWYSSNTVMPTFIAVTIVLLWLSRLLGRHSITLGLLVILVQPVFLNLRQLYPLGGATAPWPHQSTMLAAGKYLAVAELDGLIGAWNAGIIGYYQGGEVINLDGLVNNEAYPYIVENRLQEYISQKGIKYVIDFSPMFGPNMRIQGGYSELDVPGEPVLVFPDAPHSGDWQHLALYRLERKPVP